MAKKLPALSATHAFIIQRTMLQWGRAMAPVIRLLWSVKQQARPDMTVEDAEAGDNEPEEDGNYYPRMSKRTRSGGTGSGNEVTIKLATLRQKLDPCVTDPAKAFIYISLSTLGPFHWAFARKNIKEGTCVARYTGPYNHKATMTHYIYYNVTTGM
eukprot:gene42202-56056_t